MKFITFLFTVFFWFNAVAVAPYGFKGQQQSQTLYSNVLQGQNNLVTNMGGINALLETGNKNILTNPSFEHATFSTGWTNSAGTFTQDTSVEIDGLKAASLVLSSQSMALHQDSTLYASQFADGVQGLASVRVKTSVSGIKVCAKQAGVTVTSLCVDVQANGKWGLYKVPFILGATSNGISINSNGTSVTGTVYIDDAFVGATDLKQEASFITTQSSYLQQTSNFAGATITGALTTSSGSGNYSYNSATGIYTALKSGIVNISATLTSNGSTVTAGVYKNSTLMSGDTSGAAATFVTSASSEFEVVPGDTFKVTNESGNISNAQRISVSFLNAVQSSTYSSTNADTDWASCGHTAASFTGFGTPTAIETQCKRQGSDLLMKGKFTGGTPTAVEARLSLPVWNGVQLVSAGSSIIPSIQIAGFARQSSASAGYFIDTTLIETSVSYVTFGQATTGTNGVTKLTGNLILGAGNTMIINARIPIAGWQNSNIIIGQFNGLESCASTLECTDTFSASITDTGIVSQENVNFIDGNCSVVTGNFTCNYIANLVTQPMNCVTTDLSALTSPAATRVYNTTNTGFQASNTAGRGIRVICQKQGVDYVGKTAKAVASDQNVRTPGQTNVVHFAVSYGTSGTPCTASPCSIDSVGSQVSSVTRTALGIYSVNFVSPLSKVQCAYGTGYGSGGDSTVPYAMTTCSSSCSSITFQTRQTNSVGTLKDSFGNLLCTGIP